MKLRYSQQPSVDYATARARVLAYLEAHSGLMNPASVAGAIWPEHKMHAQGAGGAAARILRKMNKEDGCVVWDCLTINGLQLWGWATRENAARLRARAS